MLDKTHGEEERELLLRWNAILDQLRAYDDKQPGNSIEGLNQLITTKLTVVGLENCFETAQEASPTGQEIDFFRKRKSMLQDALYRRCFAEVGKRAADAYREVEAFFTQRLAGRFPFANEISDIYPTVAEPLALRTFFSLYDEKEGLILGVPNSTPSFDDQGPAIHAFIEQLGKVRTFLAPFLENPDSGALPVLDFEVQFRVNRQAEVGGDQVIEWRLEVGERKVVHPPRDPVVRWTSGDRMRLTLRWANESIWHPDKEQEKGALEISKKTVTYTYDNPWSVVSFLQDHPSSDSDFTTLEDEKPETLKFILKMKRDEDTIDRTTTPEERELQSKLFIRLSLIAPDSKEPIRLPEFPREAPRLPAAEDDLQD
jgi:type VI secretion system protein ImpL